MRDGDRQAGSGYLESLAPVGWRLGLDRMSRLMFALGMPQRRFASIHVVGTNGKSSTTRFATAILEAAGKRSGAYLSPHEWRWNERILIGNREIGDAELDAALADVERAAAVVETGLEDGDQVTQFEAITAAAFVAFAHARADVAVIEAGLGGRLDATNVLHSKVVVLTSVGIDHTDWLGETEAEIAAEKLAVVGERASLVVGDVSPEVATLAAETARERHAKLIDPSGNLGRVPEGVVAPYLRRNFALALTAVEACVGPVDDGVLAAAVEAVNLHGRMQQLVIDGVPVIFDVAHNAQGAAALAEAIPAVAKGRPVVAVTAILADKQADRIVAELAPCLDYLVATALPVAEVASLGRPSVECHDPAVLAEMARSAGVGGTEVVADPVEAVRRAVSLAGERDGVALVTGSHYLLRYAEEG